MKRRLIFSENSKVPAPSPMHKDLRISSFYQPSQVDCFLCRSHLNVDGSRSVRMTSDIYMLLNQKRLDRMTNAALVEHFNQMSVTNSSLTALRKKCTDEQLISLVKSRYIQSPSELLAWSQYLNTLTDEALQAIVAAQPKPDGVEPPKPDPSPTPTPSPAPEAE